MIEFKTHPLLDLPGISHGFFGRKGGVSEGTYASLNAGQGSDDDPANVAENRARIAAQIGAETDHLISHYQCHSRTAVCVSKAPQEREKADGFASTTPGLAISALSADCAPVLLADPVAGVIGACHAGWRGALSGITDATIGKMQSLGAKPDHIRAVVGSCISLDAYEVGSEFRDTFCAENEAYDRFFKLGPAKKDGTRKPHFDLKRFVLMRLRNAGLSQIDALPDCTYQQPEDYFSYRYNTHHGVSDYGRNISVIMLK